MGTVWNRPTGPVGLAEKGMDLTELSKSVHGNSLFFNELQRFCKLLVCLTNNNFELVNKSSSINWQELVIWDALSTKWYYTVFPVSADILDN